MHVVVSVRTPSGNAFASACIFAAKVPPNFLSISLVFAALAVLLLHLGLGREGYRKRERVMQLSQNLQTPAPLPFHLVLGGEGGEEAAVRRKGEVKRGIRAINSRV